ncbi:hypothetical protein M8R20_10120 [Pseudomonas sp. R2.Fl]|nr:hypothetical protein [Pseudomonas sp. R2.Fl]
MEIHSLRYTGSFLHKQASRNQKEQMLPTPGANNVRHELFSEHLEQATTRSHELTHRELREIAQSSFESGLIDLETYQQLASELPMEAVDAQGRVLDLSSITVDTPFDFTGYYRDQMLIARTLGDEAAFNVLKSAVAFLESA